MRNTKRMVSILGVRRLWLGLIIGTMALAPAWAQSQDPLYGFLVNVDSPFYNEGDTASIELNLFNFSDSDAIGSSSGGGIGCTFDVRIEDGRGATLWQPGECRAGEFSSLIPCPAIFVRIELTSGSTIGNRIDLPLVQNNPTSCQQGTNGEPIPAGVYKICVEKVFNGPNLEDTSQRGLHPTACIPVRILKAAERSSNRFREK